MINRKSIQTKTLHIMINRKSIKTKTLRIRINRKSYHCIVDVTKAEAKEDTERRAAIKEYEDHKKGFAKNIQFDGKRANKSRLFNILCNTQNWLLQKVKFLTPASTFGSW